MSRRGLQVAESFGRKLLAFRDSKEARSKLFARRDEHLQGLSAAAASSGVFAADGTPESLKKMEAWYFQLIDSGRFDSVGLTREQFEKWMATYFCHVAVTTRPGAKWHVAEYAFEPGKYEIGVKHGLMHFMRDSFTDHCDRTGNRSRTAIYRDYQKYFGSR